MKKIAQSILFLGLGCIASGVVSADDDERGRRGPDVPAVTNPLYQTECGSCHFAYQPAFLPGRSWKRLMAGLDDHFGDNAELSASDNQSIVSYLLAASAEQTQTKRSRKFLRSIGSATPLRITEVNYFRHEHDEIPKRVLRDERIGSLSNCLACHRRADKGSYAEREIRIPGVGRWED